MQLALYRPEIPPNTGNIARLCVLTDTPLHIIDKPAFSLDESAVRRAGLDYWNRLELHLHENWQAFYRKTSETGQRIFLLTRFAKTCYTVPRFLANDVCVLGSESKGLPDFIWQGIENQFPERLLRIPVKKEVRSLNLSNAAAIVLYEALRQENFSGLSLTPPTKQF